MHPGENPFESGMEKKGKALPLTGVILLRLRRRLRSKEDI